METLVQYESKYIEVKDNLNKDIFDVNLRKFLEIEQVNNNIIRIRPTKYIGIINIGDLSLYIRPKFEGLDFWEILKEVNDPSLYFFDLFITFEGFKASIDYFSVFISHFLDMIELLIKKYYRKGYQKRTERKMNIKGKINFTRQLQRNPFFFRGIYCDYSDFTFNNKLNQVIKYTLFYCKKILNRLEPSIIRKFIRIYHYFDTVQLIKISSKFIISIDYDSTTINYKKIHKICKLILTYLKFHRLGRSNEFFFTFLFDLPDIIERYLVKAIRKFSIFKISSNLKGNLAINDSLRKIRPDIAFCKNNEIIHITDVKYKTKLKREDIWQVLTYCGHYNLDKGSLLYVQEEPFEDKNYIIPMFLREIKIFIFCIALSNLSNNKYIRELVNKIEKIIK